MNPASGNTVLQHAIKSNSGSQFLISERPVVVHRQAHVSGVGHSQVSSIKN